MGLGDLYFLKVQHAHPLQFMGTLWLTAVVFSFLMYTLIATFGNAGKALGVLLLVLQISGAGGAFPLAILPSFYSSISPFLPATHAMTALRASIAGYAGHEYGDAMWLPSSCSRRSWGWRCARCWCAATGGWWPSWSPRSSCRAVVPVGTRPGRGRVGLVVVWRLLS